MHMIPPAALADLLATPTAAPLPIETTVRRFWARRARFGITRLGALTGLDRAGVPVAQVIRPLARSNAVTQGKGATLPEAAIAALMESLETWAAERIPPERTWHAPPDDTDLWADLCCRAPGPIGPLAWIEGWDLLAARPRPVPLALVDTVYTLPSPHPAWLPRDTSGLAAGTDLQGALRHACLELLEREARHRALAMPHFFDRFRIAASSVAGARSAPLLDRLRRAGMVAGIWRIPTPHGLPVYWCHLMQRAAGPDLAPLPAEGFGCDTTEDAALARALLEAAQARLTAIAGAREDVTADLYRTGPEAEHLAAWRRQLDTGGTPMPADPPPRDLAGIVAALATAGARAAIAVPLFADPDIPFAVVRLVAPPLHTNPEAAHGR